LAVQLSKDGQHGRASVFFAEAVDISDSLPADDEREHKVGALDVWDIFHNTRDTMLGRVAVWQDYTGDAAGADKTLSMIRNVSALAETRHAIAVSRIPRVSSEPGANDFPPEDAAAKLAKTGDYRGALSVASELDRWDRVRTLEEIAQTQVERGDTVLALEWADGLEPAERAPTLLAIAEAIVDQQR